MLKCLVRREELRLPFSSNRMVLLLSWSGGLGLYGIIIIVVGDVLLEMTNSFMQVSLMHKPYLFFWGGLAPTGITSGYYASRES